MILDEMQKNEREHENLQHQDWMKPELQGTRRLTASSEMRSQKLGEW